MISISARRIIATTATTTRGVVPHPASRLTSRLYTTPKSPPPQGPSSAADPGTDRPAENPAPSLLEHSTPSISTPHSPAEAAAQAAQQAGAAPGSDPLTTEQSSAQPTATASAAPIDALSRSTSLAESFLDYTEVAPGKDSSRNTFPGDKTGARAKGSKSSIEIRRRNLTRWLIAASAVSGVAYAAYLGREWDSEEEKMKLTSRTEDLQAVAESEQGGWQASVGRFKIRVEDLLDYYNKPAWDPLLPAPLPEPHYRPYTLVVDLDDLLVHSSWDLEHGWRTAKRPGVDYFLAYLSQFYEIVLFTTQPGYTAAPIVEKIDPYGAYIPWKLFRESTRYKNKSLIKDLSYLGRPLERTIMLDTDPSHAQLQPANSIILQPWTGRRDNSAKELVALIPFLEALAIKGVKDVRPVIKHYEGRHIPTAYAEAEAAQKKALVDKWEKDRESTVSSWISAALGSLTKQPSRETPPETDVEKVRRNAQRMYLEEQKYWKDNEETIKKQMDEDRERQMKEMKMSVFGLVGLAAPPPPGTEQPPQPAK